MIAEPQRRFTVAQPGEPLAARAAELAREGFTPHFGELQESFRSDRVWQQLRALGTELWLDTGNLEEARSLWTREFSNLTTNNTLVNKVVQEGLFDADIPRAAGALRGVDAQIGASALVYELGFI